MVISDTSSKIDGFTIALLTAEFGQVWAKLGLRERTTAQLCSYHLIKVV